MQFEHALVVAGLAVALLMQRAVLLLAPVGLTQAASPSGGLMPRPLAWQQPSMRPYLAGAFTLFACAAVLVAALRFEGFDAVRVAAIALALLVCTATDLLSYRVPDAVTLPALAFALAVSAVTGEPGFGSALAASALAGGLLLAAAVLTRGGLGGGDVKLGVLIGAALGLPAAAFALAAGILVGGLAVIALYLAGALGREEALPFAPFLSLAAVAFLLAG